MADADDVLNSAPTFSFNCFGNRSPQGPYKQGSYKTKRVYSEENYGLFFKINSLINTFYFYKNIVFRTEAGYSCFLAYFRMKIFLRIFLVSGISVTVISNSFIKGNRSMDMQYSMLTWLILFSHLFLLALSFGIIVQLQYT